MTAKQFVGVIRSPKLTIAELLKERENAADWRPGVVLNFVFQAVLTVAFLLLAWLLVIVFLGLGWALEGNVGFASGMLGDFLYSHLSPLPVLLEFAKSFALVLAAGIGFAMLLDLVFKNWFGHPGGEAKRIFNVITEATLPWTVFVVIPVLGLFIAAIGSMLNSYRVVAAVYGEKEPGRNILAMAAAGIGTGLAAFALSLGMAAAMRPIEQLDPLGLWTQGLSQRVIYGRELSSNEVMEKAFERLRQKAGLH